VAPDARPPRQAVEKSASSFTRPANRTTRRHQTLLGDLRLPGDPVYLLAIIHEHRARKVCYWHVMAELRRLRLRFQKSS